MVMDAMDEHPGKQIRVLGDEAHTRTNIERTLEYHGKRGAHQGAGKRLFHHYL